MARDLENKVIVVTGGGDGIGLECALAYMRAGASVAILDRNVEATARAKAKLGDSAIALHTDVSEGGSVERAITEVLEHSAASILCTIMRGSLILRNRSTRLQRTSGTIPFRSTSRLFTGRRSTRLKDLSQAREPF